MASPLHKWLFSPPLSSVELPSHIKSGCDYSSVFSSSLVNVESQRKPRSSASASAAAAAARMSVLRGNAPILASMKPIDIEAANSSGEYAEKRSPVLLSPLFSPMLKAKVAHYVPRPVQRLLAVLAAFLFFATISKYTTSLFAAPHRAPERDYVPPQAVRAPAHPRANRPDPHPLPASHELLALQSFILDSSHATLAPAVDGASPLDAVMLLGSPGARRLGGTGSEREQAWLQSLADENAARVVLWYDGERPPHYALEGVTARHGQGRRAALINTRQRRDSGAVNAVLQRLGHDLASNPVLVVGGEMFDASQERMKELRDSGKLHEILTSMGWST